MTKLFSLSRLTVLAVSLFSITITKADEGVSTAAGHAPIGVMGDHRHSAGEFMISYRYMSMSMEDNLRGDDSISADEIVTSWFNPFTGSSTVRVVPLEMTTNMHMLGMMYAPSDKLTLMAMLNYAEKEMKHLTYMGMMGTNTLGNFTTENKGLGDTKIGALWGLNESHDHKLHLNFGLSIPTGSIDEEAQVLTPMGTRPTLRMPYAMQLGSGTFDVEAGLTYSGTSNQISWGGQFLATFRTGENDEDYTLGNRLQLGGWGSYSFSNAVSSSLRLSYVDQDPIDGMDSAIAAPVQTANPDNYGGERLDLALGINTLFIGGHRVAFEYSQPIMQDLNGVQMEMQSMWTLGYQLAF